MLQHVCQSQPKWWLIDKWSTIVSFITKHYHQLYRGYLQQHYHLLLFGILSSLLSVSSGTKPSSQYATIAEHRMIMQDRAILHVNLMNTIGLCRDPRPQVVYPPSTANKIYYPRGTLVFRCTDQTGCCPNVGEVCRPETVEQIEKVFFVNHFMLGQKISGHRITPRLKPPKTNFTTVTESLTFVNHTTCKCIKLAPNTIEHDDIQSVVSRPLVVPINTISTNSFVFHLVGTFALILTLIVFFVVIKCLYINSTS